MRAAVQSSIKVETTTVPYEGTGPATTDLMGGQVELMCDQTTNMSARSDGAKVKGRGHDLEAPLDAGAEEHSDARRGRREGL